METRKKDGIHEQTDKETGQYNLQSTNKNAESEKQLQEQLPKQWMQDVQECNRDTTRQIWGIWKLRPAYSPETPNLGQNRWCFVPCDLEILWMTLENNRASLLCCFKLCATFHSHWWIQTGVTVRKRPNLGQIRRFLEPCDLAIWCMTLKNNRAPLLCYFKLYASFRSHQWIQAGVKSPETPNLGQNRPFC